MTAQENISQGIRQLILQIKPIPAHLDAKANLFKDLAFDSLAFAALLQAVEERYGVRFAIVEMEQCLIIGRLVAKVEEKVGDVASDV